MAGRVGDWRVDTFYQGSRAMFLRAVSVTGGEGGVESSRRLGTPVSEPLPEGESEPAEGICAGREALRSTASRPAAARVGRPGPAAFPPTGHAAGVLRLRRRGNKELPLPGDRPAAGRCAACLPRAWGDDPAPVSLIRTLKVRETRSTGAQASPAFHL